MRRLRSLLAAALVAPLIMMAPAPQSQASVVYNGLGFDTCGAPSTGQMSAWLASPYRSVGIYVGGANRACGDGNLSAAWVGAVEGQGWRLVPEYVGLQAPCADQPGLAPIDPASATLQGTQAADDAVARAANFGLGVGTPIYFDMEAYGTGCSATVLDFLSAWTVELHNRGYVSGVYSSSTSGIQDEANAFTSIHPVDDIFFANWNGTPNIFGDPFIPDNLWANGQRLHQFSGNQVQSFGGVTISIDEDADAGAVAGQCGPSCSSPIQQHYQQLGGSAGFLGPPVGPELVTPGGAGAYEQFVNGYIYWSPSTGAHEVHGTILAHWAALGYEQSVLGFPTTDETGTPDGIGRYNHFQNGSIYWTPFGGAWEVHGAIQGHWAGLRWEAGPLGYPITDETSTPDRVGRYNHFQNGSIYWTPATGAWEVHGAIQGHWASLRWEAGPLGYPITDETAAPDGIGRFNHFQNGSIYWTSRLGAWEVQGAIQARWASLRWEAGPLGYPITDETGAPDGIGRFNHFQNGSIYWTPVTGAWEVQGAIRAHWAALGWERSAVGYPTSNETPTPDGAGRYNTFQSGNIYWGPATGAFDVYGIILEAYLYIQATQSRLGYPTSDVVHTLVGARSTFQSGSIDWNAVTGRVTVTVT